jgi:hypothetical protein
MHACCSYRRAFCSSALLLLPSCPADIQNNFIFLLSGAGRLDWREKPVKEILSNLFGNFVRMNIIQEHGITVYRYGYTP